LVEIANQPAIAPAEAGSSCHAATQDSPSGRSRRRSLVIALAVGGQAVKQSLKQVSFSSALCAWWGVTRKVGIMQRLQDNALWFVALLTAAGIGWAVVASFL
jgi:hypothetical protein